jgi:hypothetical protein
MEEVDGKTQAELELKLSDNVRELVRMHLRQALEDYGFVSGTSFHSVGMIISPLVLNSPAFQQAVKNAILTQMNKL